MRSAALLSAAATLFGAAAAAASLPGLTFPRAPRVRGPEVFYSASDPSVWTVGRFAANADGSKSFDWENSNININVANATYVTLLANSTGGAHGRFIAESDGWEVASFYVGGPAAATEFLVAADLSGTRHIRVTSTLEPAFMGAGPAAFLTFIGFKTDGVALPATPRARRIELVGDSISAGYGSRGFANTPFGCPVDENTSGNKYTYNWMLAQAFDADISPIAWSGKGMYENCCDSGIKMPSLYLQTFGGRSYTTDYDFAWVPGAFNFSQF